MKEQLLEQISTCIDLGADISSEKFLSTIEKYPKAVIGMSALLTTTMNNMEKSVKDIKEVYPNITIWVGGAPPYFRF